jgi:hypothetical protein
LRRIDATWWSTVFNRGEAASLAVRDGLVEVG